jgi:DNA-binding transcriptional ArsR family regulator
LAYQIIGREFAKLRTVFWDLEVGKSDFFFKIGLHQLIFFTSLNKKNPMGASKIKAFTASQKSFARVAKAIGHPARVAIIQHLSQERYATNTAFMQLTNLSKATIHQHLKELVVAGLIVGTFIGNRHYYRLVPSAFDRIENLKKVIGL